MKIVAYVWQNMLKIKNLEKGFRLRYQVFLIFGEVKKIFYGRIL